MPRLNTKFEYNNRPIGISALYWRTCLMISKQSWVLMFSSSARMLAAWITGPSAIGSENGIPSSRASAPPSIKLLMISTLSALLGSPIVTKGTKAPWLVSFNVANSCP